MEVDYILLFIKKKAPEFQKYEKLVLFSVHYAYCVETLPE